ncbi:MAG: hypothetical protein QXF82_09620 [Nitrososphaeria archaeon]
MSQPIANIGLPFYIYKCGKKKQYLCMQSSGPSTASNFTLGTNQSRGLPFPGTILPVPTKIHVSGFAYLASAAPVSVYFLVSNIYGSGYPVYVNFEVSNNGTVINIPEQDIVLEPYAFTTAQAGALTIQALSTVTVNQFNAFVYVEVPD